MVRLMLDIEVAGAIAPEPKSSGVLRAEYRTPASWMRSMPAVHDATQALGDLDQLGGAGIDLDAQSLNARPGIQNAAHGGVTVCAASGDNGSSDGRPVMGADQSTFRLKPFRSPLAGGTSLNDKWWRDYGRELVWKQRRQRGGASGGGCQSVFPLAAMAERDSARSAATGQAVPLTKTRSTRCFRDADPSTGYHVRVDSTETVFGGTSAVAPLWQR